MSAEDIRAEGQVEPDPAATSIGNDQTVNETSKPEETAAVDSAPTVSDDAKAAEEKTVEDKTTEEKPVEDKTIEDKPVEDKTAEDKPAENKQATEKVSEEKTAEDKPAEDNKSADQKKSYRENNNRVKKQEYKANVKSDFTDLPESSDANEIRRQVEFYFSDSNLPTDKYLLQQTGGHKNLPVDLKVIHNFKRMRHFQPWSAVVEAVKSSKMLDLNDKNEITRKVPLSDRFTDDVEENRALHADSTMARSIYAKGFGNETKTTQTEIEEFFSMFGNVNAVRLRRRQDGLFKGSVFVEYSTEEEAAEFLALKTKPFYKVAGSEDRVLDIKSKKEYCDQKVEDIKSGKIAPKSPRREKFHSRGGGGGGFKGNGGARGGGNFRGKRGGHGGNSRGGRDGPRRGGHRDGGRGDGPRDRNAEREGNEKKRSAPDADAGAAQGEAKKAKTDE